MTLVVRKLAEYGDRSLSLRLAGCRSSWGSSVEARLEMAVDARQLAIRIHNAGLDRQVRVGPVSGLMADTVRVWRGPEVDWEII